MTDAVAVELIAGAVAIVTAPQLWGFLIARKLAKATQAKVESVETKVDGTATAQSERIDKLTDLVIRMAKQSGADEANIRAGKDK